MSSLKEHIQLEAAHPRLPQELTDIVIDHLHCDKESLRACALVSHGWLWSARYHLLFTTVVNTSDKKFGLDPFLSSLSSSPLQLGNHVKCLHIQGAHDKDHDDFASVLQFVNAVLPKVPSIRRINLSRMVWGQSDLLLPLEQAPMPWELGTLSLKDIRLEASDAQSLAVAQRHLSYLLQQFSSIRLLTIDTVRIGYRALYRAPHHNVAGVVAAVPVQSEKSSVLHRETHDDFHHHRQCRITALNCFTEDDSFYLLAALSRLGFAQNLQTLKFGSGCPEITSSAQVVANLAASSLKFVRYRVPSDDYGE